VSELEEIRQKAEALKLEFLLIGGLAVIEHGFTRTTNDIDLLIRKQNADSWNHLVVDLGYKLLNDGGSFLQYERPAINSWPLDLMLVNDPTYDSLQANSLPANVLGASLRIVSLRNLLMLKLHALKQKKIHRFLHDFNDLVELVKANRLDLQSSEYRDLFLKYGTSDLYDKIHRIAKSQ
jgi:hypothetical protein